MEFIYIALQSRELCTSFYNVFMSVTIIGDDAFYPANLKTQRQSQVVVQSATMKADHVQGPSVSINLVDWSFKYLPSKPNENSVSDLNHNKVTWLFFIVLPYRIRDIESRCPQCNSWQTPGRSYWDQTHTADNSCLLNPYVTWAHPQDPTQIHRISNMPCEVVKYWINITGFY